MQTLQIDIVSDVMCPWCIIGYKGLESALNQLSDTVKAEINWMPFELNPQ
ncbi:MAG: DsbA family protein, partial [Pseudomonadota bacterium]|nr:DsbA family protein [Pseudomonadota bacterium]